MKRWKHRPEGSTWGDWGDDDQLGRLNLITPKKVLEGIAEVKEGLVVLPQPAARPARRQRAEPAPPAAGAVADRRRERLALQLPHQHAQSAVHGRGERRPRDPDAAVLDAMGHARPCRRHVRRRRRRRARAALLQRLQGRLRRGRARRPTPAATAAAICRYAHKLGVENMARQGDPGPRRDGRPREALRPRPQVRRATTISSACSRPTRSWSSRATCCCSTPASPTRS